MQTLNKGEWAEFYVFIKLLADGRLYYGDEKMNILPDEYFEIDKILKMRNGVDQVFYIYDTKIESDTIETDRNDLRESAQRIFDEVTSKNGTFSIEEAEDLKKILDLERFSEPSKLKADIHLSLIDGITQKSNTYSFSIKTKFKGKSTLINASGKSTGFRYKVDNFDDNLMHTVNSIEGGSKINQRVSKIYELGGVLSFCRNTSEIYESNLRVIDTAFDKIIAELMLVAYLENQKTIHKAIELKHFYEFYNHLGLKNVDSIVYKIKNFLYASAIGMTPSKIWKGSGEVDGGLIIVKNTGDLIGYFVFSLEKFKEYLWQNTYFETPSTSRHQFGFIFKEDGEYFFDLNLQIRFS